MAKRRKSEVLPAAQSRDEAIQLLARYAALDAQVEARKARLAAGIAQMSAECDGLNAPLLAEQAAIFDQVKPWWAVAGKTVTEGDRKTAELGGCLIGHRIGNPTLKYPSPEPTAVRLLLEKGWKGLLRIKFELDKPAIMAALRWLAAPERPGETGDENVDVAAARQWFTATGFKVTQKEDFFIDRLPATHGTIARPDGAGTGEAADLAPAQQVAA